MTLCILLNKKTLYQYYRCLASYYEKNSFRQSILDREGDRNIDVGCENGDHGGNIENENGDRDGDIGNENGDHDGDRNEGGDKKY